MALQIKDISFRYGTNLILDKISFEQKTGRILALLGPNGTGKTTLLKSLSGILQPFEGSSLLDGEDILKMSVKKKSRLIAYVPQNTTTVFPVKVFDAVMMGRKPFQGFHTTKKDEEIVLEILELFELTKLAFKNTNELSGGERQRVFLARALCQQPRLLLLDEPTSSMDLKNQLRTMSMVRKLADSQDLTLLFLFTILILPQCTVTIFLCCAIRKFSPSEKQIKFSHPRTWKKHTV